MVPHSPFSRALMIAALLAGACERDKSATPDEGAKKGGGKAEKKDGLPEVVTQQVKLCLEMSIESETGQERQLVASGACQTLVPLTPEVEKHLQDRCDDDEAAACHMLGDMLRGERIVKYIAELVRTSCGKKTCDVIRRQYAVIEVGTARADATAKVNELLERACTLGRAEACLTRATIEDDITVDPQWAGHACVAGSSAGCAHHVHHAIRLGGANVATTTAAKLSELCDGGRATACASLGVLVARGNKEAKALGKPALDLWSHACIKGSSGGCASVVFHAMLAKVDTTTRDAAAQALTKDCPDGKVGPDCTAAAFALFKGWSVPVNKPAARTWLAKNCDAGIEAACEVPKK
jgi:TPR repeat protein